MGPSVMVAVADGVMVGAGEKVNVEETGVAVGTGVPASARSLTDRTSREIMGTNISDSNAPKNRTPIRIRGKMCI